MFYNYNIRKKIAVVVLTIVFSISFFNMAFAIDLEKDKTIYTVSNAHLDTQWNWNVRDTINSYLPKTFNDNFYLFEKYPDYNFNFEGAFRYSLIKEYYPQAYENMKKYIDKGRWNVVGSSWDAGDVNIPSPEALMRNILLGNGFFEKEFNKKSADIFLPDCFGFGYTLPTVASHMGLKGFSTQKLSWGSAYGIPFDIGKWYGVDGSSIIAALNPGEYVTNYNHSLSSVGSKWVDRVNENGSKYGIYGAYSYYGTGDTGGAPSESSVNIVQKDIDKGFDPNTNVQVISASADQMYKDITEKQVKNLPFWNNELVMSTHGVGGYTSKAISKRWNRHNELLADAAERTNVISNWIGATSYPKENLNTAWERFIWHQMHDDLPGTSVPSAYQITWNDYILSLNQFSEELINSVGSIACCMNTNVKGVPVLVYNPISKERKDIVEAKVHFDKEVPKAIKVFDTEGKEVPSQISEKKGNNITVLFLADMPSVSYKLYDIVPSNSKSKIYTGLKITNSTLENNYCKVTIDRNGDICSIYDKKNKKELLAAPSRLELFDDNSMSWPSWEILYEDITKPPREYVSGPVDIEILEKGPARVALKTTRKAAGSTFSQIIRLSASDDATRVDVDNNIDWKSRSSLLKVSFPLTVSNPNATYDLGIGTIRRGNNTKKLYEVPAQQWADITNKSKDYGVSILNDCKYGWDKPNNNSLRLTLIHTPKYSFGDNKQNVQDFGENRFLYSIYGHKGDWNKEDQTVAQSERINQPLKAFQVSKHNGKLDKNISFLNIDKPNVTVKALKKSEKGNKIIVRVQETSGKNSSNVNLFMGNGIKSAKEVNGFEENKKPATVKNGKLVFDINKYEPKTFAISLIDPTIEIDKPSFKNIKLPFNKDVVSFDNNRKDGSMDQKSRTIPAELFPSLITSGGTKFKMGSKKDGHYNAVSSCKQEISIPDGCNKLYFLATSTAGDITETFKIDGKPINIEIKDYKENVGGWDNFGAGKFNGIKRTPVAWVATHTHTPKGNSAYDFIYLFKHKIDLPEDAKTITLPNNEDVLIFAMTASDEKDDIIPAKALYDIKKPKKTYSLKVENGSGSGAYPKDTDVSIVAEVPSGYAFDGWIGPVENPDSLKTIIKIPDKDIVVKARLKKLSTNIALNKSATASGYVNEREKPEFAVDGNRNTKWCEIGDKNKWLEIDLKKKYKINRWIVRHAGDGKENVSWNTSDFKLQMSNDGNNWIDIDEVKNNTENITDRIVKTFSARYVRLFITKATNVSDTAARIYEFELYSPEV